MWTEKGKPSPRDSGDLLQKIEIMERPLLGLSPFSFLNIDWQLPVHPFI
jgi:hypothetical protein